MFCRHASSLLSDFFAPYIQNTELEGVFRLEISSLQ